MILYLKKLTFKCKRHAQTVNNTQNLEYFFPRALHMEFTRQQELDNENDYRDINVISAGEH